MITIKDLEGQSVRIVAQRAGMTYNMLSKRLGGYTRWQIGDEAKVLRAIHERHLPVPAPTPVLLPLEFELPKIITDLENLLLKLKAYL